MEIQVDAGHFSRQLTVFKFIFWFFINNVGTLLIRFVVDNRIKSRHTANAVLKQAGLPKKF